MTWPELVAREPRLEQLLHEARAVRDPGEPDGFCANAVWYGWGGNRGLKPRLRELVGWERPSYDPVLSEGVAYDVAYQTIYDALPPCRGGAACKCL